jgi:RNA polymerase sigma-70 factor (ECF subfamily)
LLFIGARGEEERPLADESALRPDQLAEQNGMSECVLRFLSRLPETQRAVLLLHDLQGYTDQEIAVELSITLQNAKIRLHRARAGLRAALAEGCDFSRNDRGVFICEPKSGCS